MKLASIGSRGLQQARLGKGRVIVGELSSALAEASVSREPMVDLAGLNFIRRSFDGGRITSSPTAASRRWISGLRLQLQPGAW